MSGPGMFEDTTLFTNKRVNQFVTDFNNYISSLSNGSSGKGYQYYHFINSPVGVQQVPLGAVNSSLFSKDLLQPYTNVSGKENAPEGHKMNIAVDYNRFLSTVDETVLTDKKIVSVCIDISDAVLKPTSHYMNKFIEGGSWTTEKKPETRNFGLETLCYIKVSEVGQFRFDISCSNFACWMGDMALCEYTEDNVTATSESFTSFTFNVSSPSWIPLRIQVFSPTSNFNSDIRKLFKLQIFQGRGTLANVRYQLKCKTIDVTKTPKDILPGAFFLSPPLYVAYTSESLKKYTPGQFLCYTNLSRNLVSGATSTPDSNAFYRVLLAQKEKILVQGAYERDVDNNEQYGQLPSLQGSGLPPTFFTESEGSTWPQAFYLYRISVDPRLDGTFQINSTPNENRAYAMKKIDPKNLDYAGSYKEQRGYYPISRDMNRVQTVDANACKKKCNESQNCSHYYTYTENQVPKCVLGADGDQPVFNQVRATSQTTGSGATERASIDLKSGSLFLRNRELNAEQTKKCAGFKQVSSPTIVNTEDYTPGFQFSKYVIDGSIITSVDDLGVCGDDKYQKFADEARDILLNPHIYNSEGKLESFSTKYTDARGDTIDSAQANIRNHDVLGQKMTEMNDRYLSLRDQIGDFNRMNKVLLSDNRYDHNGNVLMFLREKTDKDLSLINQHVADSKELSESQTLVFYTGIVTAATLIVLALVMGKSS